MGLPLYAEEEEEDSDRMKTLSLFAFPILHVWYTITMCTTTSNSTSRIPPDEFLIQLLQRLLLNNLH